MASQAGKSKKHSPLQMAHYQQYRLEGRAEKNLIRRLMHRVRLNNIKANRNIKRQEMSDRSYKAGGPRGKFITVIKPDLGAIKRLKQLGVKGLDRYTF